MDDTRTTNGTSASTPQKAKGDISFIAGGILVVFAVICDAVGLIPFAKDFMEPLFWIVTGFYLWLKGYGLFSGRKLATMGISLVTGLIPIVQEIPQTTLGIAAMLIILNLEKKTGLPVSSMAGGTSKLPTVQPSRVPARPAPLNQGGMRMPSN